MVQSGSGKKDINKMRVGDIFITPLGGCYKIDKPGHGQRCSCAEYYRLYPKAAKIVPDPVLKVELYEERVMRGGTEPYVEKEKGIFEQKDVGRLAAAPIVLVAIAVGVLGYFLFGRQRG